MGTLCVRRVICLPNAARADRLKSKIGIFAGTFNPIHAGHIAFALAAAKAAELDEVIFLPERRPRHKPGVEHFGHRTAMIARAILPHNKLKLLELPDVQFDVERTLPKLQQEFAGSELYFLMGSDSFMALNSSSWSDSNLRSFLKSAGLVVGVRSGDDYQKVLSAAGQLPLKPSALLVIESPASDISSSKIRRAITTNQPASGLLKSASKYAKAQWLYLPIPKG